MDVFHVGNRNPRLNSTLKICKMGFLINAFIDSNVFKLRLTFTLVFSGNSLGITNRAQGSTYRSVGLPCAPVFFITRYFAVLIKIYCLCADCFFGLLPGVPYRQSPGLRLRLPPHPGTDELEPEGAKPDCFWERASWNTHRGKDSIRPFPWLLCFTCITPNLLTSFGAFRFVLPLLLGRR